MRLRCICGMLSVLGVATFAGCGGSSSTSVQTPKTSAQTKTVVKKVQPPGGPGTYSYKDPSGAIFTVTIPAPATYPLAQQLATERRRLGVSAAIAYVTVTIDNTGGSQPIDLDATSDVLEIVTADGQQVTFQTGDRQTACVADSSASGCEAGSATYNQDINLYNKLLNSKKVLSGAKSKSLFVTTTKAFTIKRVFLLQAPSSPSTPVEMTKASATPAAGQTSTTTP